MVRETRPVRRKPHRGGMLPGYVHHRDFDGVRAAREYDPAPVLAEEVDHGAAHMPDEETKRHSKFMHYAAHRMHRATRPAEFRAWHARYIALRDRIILGNRKLIYRAVRRRMGHNASIDDLIGDCHIVLLNAVAVFNPWMGIRFSTYAYTCLVRAMVRLARKSQRDWLSGSISFEAFPSGEPSSPVDVESSHAIPLEEFFRAGHPLLTDREKAILGRRFGAASPTLEKVGRDLGLSKERVRQVQTLALEKLRIALTGSAA